MTATRPRTIRIPDPLYDRAKQICAEEGTNVAREVNAFLQRKVDRYDRKQRRQHPPP